MLIQVQDVDYVCSAEVISEMNKVEAGTIETTNGEISDAAARAIARMWGRLGSSMSHLERGLPVDADDLLDDISATARQAMGRTHQGWPRELEHLSTWVINHE